MCSDLSSCSQFCALFSGTGILFMSWVGVLLVTQPFYIPGINNVETAKGSAFGAAAAFFICFVISSVYLIYDAQVRANSGLDDPRFSSSSRSSTSSVGSNNNRILSRNGAGGSSASDLFSRAASAVPFPTNTGALFHDYDPVDTEEIVDRGGVLS